jgi:phospholipid/cholesterol/gamma-HCH transport system substrate-binding protein
MDNKNIKLGLFFSGGLIILVVILYIVGSKQNMFEKNIELISSFTDAQGLQEGSAVRFIGITIGSVDEISIANDTCINVSMIINKEQSRFITSDAFATINSDGLMGNKLITIVPGSSLSDPIEDGDEIQSKKPVGLDNIMNSVLENSRNLEDLTSNLVEISDHISSGEGLIGKLLYDTVTAQKVDRMTSEANQMINNLNSTSANIKQVSEEITEGKGTLGRLINDTTLVNNIDYIMDSLSIASSNINSASIEFKEFAENLNNGIGPLGRLVNDSVMADNLNQTIANAKERTEELEETIEIVNDSWILNLFSKNRRNDED